MGPLAVTGALCAAGCVGGSGSGPDFEPGKPLTLQSVESGIEATVTARDGRFVVGINSMTVKVESGGDVEVVSAGAFMPAHGHGTDAPAITPADGSYRVEDLNLFMPGRWEVGIDLRVGDAADQLEFTVDVK